MMAGNQVFRVYDDEETMLAIYSRRLSIADKKFDKLEPDRNAAFSRYREEPKEGQFTSRGHRITTGVGTGIIDTLYSSMVAVDVEFICKAMGHGTRSEAYVATEGLNQAWRDTKGQKRCKKAIKDALLADVGWVKVYYDYQTDVMTLDRPDAAIKAEMEELFGKDKTLTADDLASMVPTREDQTVVMRDRVCVDYVPWKFVRYDPTAKQVEDIRWVAQYTPQPKTEVVWNPTWRAYVLDRYGEAEGLRLLDDLEGDSKMLTGLESDMQTMSTVPSDEHDDDSRVTVVEMWDFETGLVTVFPRDRQDLVLHQRLNPLMMNLDLEDRNPFKPIMSREVSDEFEGLSDARLMANGLEELDEYRSNIATHIARTIPKFFGPENGLTKAGKKALESTEWGAYVETSAQTPPNGIYTPQLPVLAQEVYGVPQQIAEELKEATGATDTMRGVFTSKRQTAAETQLVTGKGDLRQAERRGNLEEWYLSIARTMLQLIQTYYDAKRMQRFVTETGEEFTWEWSREDIAMEADIDCAITPAENLTRDERLQRMMLVMNLLIPLPETSRPDLIRAVLRETGILSEEDILKLVKSPEELQKEQEAAQLETVLSARPSDAGGPPGLAITGFGVRTGGGARTPAGKSGAGR
jgi:hypothetical protein